MSRKNFIVSDIFILTAWLPDDFTELTDELYAQVSKTFHAGLFNNVVMSLEETKKGKKHLQVFVEGHLKRSAMWYIGTKARKGRCIWPYGAHWEPKQYERDGEGSAYTAMLKYCSNQENKPGVLSGPFVFVHKGKEIQLKKDLDQDSNQDSKKDIILED